MHSEVGPSVKARIIQCRGCVQMCRPYMPQPDTEETREGNAADWTAQRYHDGFNVIPGTLHKGVPVTEEMIRGAILWRDVGFRDSVCQSLLPIERIHETEFGTPDRWKWFADTRTLYVDEYKFGHRLVDAFKNWQCIDYATGILDVLGEANAQDITIVIRIVQPRYYNAEPVRQWVLNSGALRAYTNISHMATHEALEQNPVCKTGPECLDCAASHDCKTLQSATTAVLEYLGKPERTPMPVEGIGVELELLDDAATLLEARARGLRVQAESHFFGGKVIGRWKMERKRGRRKWVVPTSQVIEAAKSHGVDVTASQDLPLITPTQAIQRGLPEAVVSTIAERPSQGWQLVRDDGREARKLFGASST